MADETADIELRELTAGIVSAYVARNTLDAETLPDLIHQVYETISSLGKVEAAPEKPVPAVPLKKSVFPDYIVCLEDGKKLKMLKRHLKKAYNMTPEEYREPWGLPHDYPMVAPSYARHPSSPARKVRQEERRIG